MTRRRPWSKKVRAAAAIAAGATLLSCETIEKVLPYAIVAGGAIASVVALNYLSDCGNDWAVCEEDPFTGEEVRDIGYTEQVLLMIGTLTTVGGVAADYWADHREKQRELARLEEVEDRVDHEYAMLQGGGPPANAWGQTGAWPAPAAQPARWGTAAPGAYGQQGWAQGAPQPAYGAYPPQGGYPPNAYPPPPGPPGAGPWGYPPPGGQPLLQPRSVQPPIALETAILKRAGEGFVPIEDNEILFDGNGEAVQDAFQVLFRPNQVSWVYVIGVDAVGRVQPLYPNRYPDQTNPIGPGEAVLLPGSGAWYELDRYDGLQHVFFYVSNEREEELEKQLAVFHAKPPPEPTVTDEKVYSVSVPTFLQHDRLQARGFRRRGEDGALARGIVTPVAGDILRIPGGANLRIPTKRVVASTVGQPLVVTRVFQHQ